MRILSILCGLAFAVTAGLFLACAMIATSRLPGGEWPALAEIFVPVSRAALVLALLVAGLAWQSRCEGWLPLVAGCVLFVLCDLALHAFAVSTGSVVPALLCLAAAGLVLMPLLRTPNSYWRVAG